MSGYFAQAPRPPLAEEMGAARLLLVGALGVTPYIDRALEALELAERSRAGADAAEYRALVIARDGTVAGLVLFGMVPGCGHAKLHAAVLATGVSADDVGERLMSAMSDGARASGATFILAEMPDDPAVGSMLVLLRQHGFREEARVPDFYRDGVALSFLRLTLRS